MSEEKKKTRTAYLNEHQRTHYKRYVSLLRKDTDKELIEKLESVKSINDYVYKLIKKDVYGDNYE